MSTPCGGNTGIPTGSQPSEGGYAEGYVFNSVTLALTARHYPSGGGNGILIFAIRPQGSPTSSMTRRSGSTSPGVGPWIGPVTCSPPTSSPRCHTADPLSDPARDLVEHLRIDDRVEPEVLLRVAGLCPPEEAVRFREDPHRPVVGRRDREGVFQGPSVLLHGRLYVESTEQDQHRCLDPRPILGRVMDEEELSPVLQSGPFLRR